MFGRELFAEVVEGVVPAVDAWNTVVEVLGNFLDELLALSVFSLLGSQEVDMWPIPTKFLDKFGFPDATSPVDDVEVVAL